MNAATQERLLRLPAVLARTGISCSALYRKMEAGTPEALSDIDVLLRLARK